MTSELYDSDEPHDSQDPYLPRGRTAPSKIGKSGTPVVTRDVANFLGCLVDHAYSGNGHLERILEMVKQGSKLLEKDAPRLPGLVSDMLSLDENFSTEGQVIMYQTLSAAFAIMSRANQYRAKETRKPDVSYAPNTPITSLNQLIDEILAHPRLGTYESVRMADYITNHREEIVELVKENELLRSGMEKEDSSKVGSSPVPSIPSQMYPSLDQDDYNAVCAVKRMSLMTRYQLSIEEKERKSAEEEKKKNVALMNSNNTRSEKRNSIGTKGLERLTQATLNAKLKFD